MKKITSRQSAQIGIVAVLLTTVLLAIGVSVTTQVVDQVAQDTARQESNQAFNVAESQVDISAGLDTAPGTVPGTGFATNTQSSDHSIALAAGDTVEVKYEAPSGPSDVSWTTTATCNDTSSATDPCAAILVSWYPSPGTTAVYYPITPGSPTGNRTGYESADSPCSPGSQCKKTLGSLGISGAGTLRVKALYASTNISIPGLITVTRTAAANTNGGEEVRVAEQEQTQVAAPSVLDYALFAGSGSVGSI